MNGVAACRSRAGGAEEPARAGLPALGLAWCRSSSSTQGSRQLSTGSRAAVSPAFVLVGADARVRVGLVDSSCEARRYEGDHVDVRGDCRAVVAHHVEVVALVTNVDPFGEPGPKSSGVQS